MSQDKYQNTLDGEEFATEDFNAVAAEAANADEVALQEFLRLRPYVGTGVAKAILAYGPAAGHAGDVTAFVQPGNAGTVKVMPFRYAVGSRDSVANIGAQPNWQDQQSGIFAKSSDGTTLGYQIPTSSFPSNASGSARIDLVYAKITLGVPTGSVTRLVKPPTGGSATPTLVDNPTTSVVVVDVVTGTPSGTPALPTLPSDSLVLGVFYVALAYVIIPNGFTLATTAILPENIHEVAPVRPASANRPLGLMGAGPMRCVSDALSINDFARWASSGKAFVPWAMPATMVGATLKFFGVSRNAGASELSIADAGAVDDSMDWRNRIFLVFMQGLAGTANFPFAHGFNTTAVPGAANGTGAQTVTMGQSFSQDDVAVMGVNRNAATVFYDNKVVLSTVNQLGLYVDLTTGILRIYHSLVADSFNGSIFFWVLASGQFDNAG